MKYPPFYLVTLTSALLATAGEATQLANDPPSYFGGADFDNQQYLDWANAIASKYDSSVYLPSIEPSEGAAIHWRITDNEWLEIAVAARSTGWVGFGISEAGGMLGSDMVLFVTKRPSELTDAHVLDSFIPDTDDCQQDWILVDGSPTTATVRQGNFADANNFIMFEARRKLDTGDDQDKRILNDADPSFPAHRVIAAWGDSEEVSYHGTSVARGAIRFFDASDPAAAFQSAMDVKAEGSFSIQAKNFTIPAGDTTYMDFCLSRNDLLSQGVPDSTQNILNVIGFRPILDPITAPYVHHFIVYGSFNGRSDVCDRSDDDEGGDPGFDHIVYVWAPGEGAFELPDTLGAPLFGLDGYQSFSIEIHYDNPRLSIGKVDSSGVQLFYTSQAREREIGVLQLGDPWVELEDIPVGNGLTRHDFECPGTCSGIALSDNKPVTVLREYLHMHQDGIRMTNEQSRDGKVIRQASVEVWDFDQNGNAAVQQEAYQILPGDSFRTKCYYKGSAGTVFGLSSRQEMCIAFLYYYPRKVVRGEGWSIPWLCAYGFGDSFPPCDTSHTVTALAGKADINREFGEPQCKVEVDGHHGTDGTEKTFEPPVDETDEPVATIEPPDDEDNPVVSDSASSGSLGGLACIVSASLSMLLA